MGQFLKIGDSVDSLGDKVDDSTIHFEKVPPICDGGAAYAPWG